MTAQTGKQKETLHFDGKKQNILMMLKEGSWYFFSTVCRSTEPIQSVSGITGHMRGITSSL